MKYYTIAFPGEFGQHVVETWSEEQILKSYSSYWYHKMCESNQHHLISNELCIEDWCTVHWAYETNEFGNALLAKAASMMSDKGYSESTHEKQAEFARKRNYHISNTDNPIDFPEIEK